MEIVVAPEEVSVLLAHKRGSPFVLVRAKAEAVFLASRGVDVAVVAESVERTERTVKEWLRAWRKVRLASVVSGHAGNLNASLLTAEQRREVIMVLGGPPSAVGLAASFWDVPTLRGWLSSRFEVVYESDSTYHLLLTHAGLSFKKPDAFDRRRDETKIAERMARIAEQVAPLLEDQEWEVFTADEVRLEHEAELRRAWLPRGERTIVKVNRKREAQSWFGALNQKTGICELVRMDWQDTVHVIEALKHLSARYPGKKLAIVWDNAAFHRGKDLRALLGLGNLFAHITLIHMPPYAPDENPVEHVWGWAKDRLANIQRDHPGDTFAQFEHEIKNRTFNYKLKKPAAKTEPDS